MLLYHGSNVEVSEPRLLHQTRGLDFGAGFYVTSNEQQAKDFSRNVMRRARTGKPIVSVYEYDEQTAETELEILRFRQADADWLIFVKDNRMKVYEGKLHDVVIGPVANDRVFPTIQAWMIGQFSVEAALVELKTKKLFDQHCFGTQQAIERLQFVRSYEMGEGM
jgi:hypothetical protein